MKKSDKDAALDRAIRAAGGPVAVATFINANFDKKVTPQAVSQWRRCPSGRAIQLERAARGVVTRHELRPELYPIEEVM